ncbi:MAG: sigma-54 dependent transcriptional regulator [Planctomycetota bacterium]|nr:sigma-54 dependent transcriptional regulator [Planctomycetota bacterium]
MANVLIIDDNQTNRETYADLLGDEGHTCLTAGTGEEGLAKMTGAAVDCVLCDLMLPNLDGLQTMELAHERHGTIPWILITGHGSEEIAVTAIKQGAFNYLTKPVDMQRLTATIESASRVAKTTNENKALRKELGYDEALDRIVGTSQAIKQVKQVIRQVAATDANVLIDGESGTGKELVADAIYALSRRSGRPYVKVNTAAIPRELLESELFGHERGAFTGAVQQKKGKFEQADTGTIFLDEIGEMPLDSQVKLLRVLQDGTFNRVGGNEQIATNVRLICATNRNLKNEVLAGNFRMDLYYRMNVVNIRVPALRERREDIPLLSKHFIDHLSTRHGGNKQAIDELTGALRRMDWPGNVRELENTLEKLYVLTPGRQIDASLLNQEHAMPFGEATPSPDLGPTTPAPQPAVASNGSNVDDTPPGTEDDAIRALVGLPVDEVERRLILATLDHCKGNKSKAARLLQIGLKTLYRKLENYGKKG